MSEESRLYVGFVQEELPSVLKEEKISIYVMWETDLEFWIESFFVLGFSKRSMLTGRKILKNHYLKSGPKGCLNKMHNFSVIVDFMNNPTESYNLQK